MDAHQLMVGEQVDIDRHHYVIPALDFEARQATLRSFHPEADNGKRIDFHHPPLVMPLAQLPVG